MLLPTTRAQGPAAGKVDVVLVVVVEVVVVALRAHHLIGE